MGRDKAWIEVEGTPLLARQLALLRTVGANEVFISGRSGVDYRTFGYPVIEDAYPDAGPLAGIERGLARTENRQLLVLAVDLPRMTALYLDALVRRGSPERGVVPCINGKLEPLVALYPKGAHPIAARALAEHAYSVQQFAHACRLESLVEFMDVPAADQRVFLNFNTPGDL